MDPQEAVICLGEILVTMPEFSEDGVYEAMVNAGMPPKLADRTYKFTQIAWGRWFLGNNKFLDDLRITMSPAYMCLNADGNIIELG